jgi:hypothetical protein
MVIGILLFIPATLLGHQLFKINSNEWTTNLSKAKKTT